MLTTLDLFTGAPPVFAPFVPAVPAAFADSAALAAWLNRLPLDITGQYHVGGARWPWEGDLGSSEYQLAVWCERPHAADHVAGLCGYFFSGPLAMGGEWAPLETPGWAAESGRLFVFDADLTKSQRDDIGAVLFDPAGGLEAMLRDGSPIRKTDRAGQGTRGTRKWGGLSGRFLLAWR
jgi:hypothetical protein